MNNIIPGCSVFENLLENVYEFLLDKDISISKEYHPYDKLLIVEEGKLFINDDIVGKGECLYIPKNTLVGVKSITPVKYKEIQITWVNTMNLKAGEVLKIKEEIPYANHKVISKNLIDNEHMKYVLMSFDQGTGLTPHRAPGEALVTVLEGTVNISCEGKDYLLNEGENFVFKKGGLHALTAITPFKMTLLLTLH